MSSVRLGRHRSHSYRVSALCFIVVMVAGWANLVVPAPHADASTTVTIQNFDGHDHQVTKFDTDGNALDAHEPYITQFPGDSTYYLYGTSMGCGSLSSIPSHTPWCGDRVYSSPDLIHWQSRGLLFDPNSAEWQNRCGLVNPFSSVSTQSSCFRPKVIYNPSTHQYVLWVNFGVNPNDNASNPVTGKYYVLTSSSPVGPFTEVGPATLAQQWDNDETLFVDGSNAYVVYMQQVDANNNPHRLVVEQLNSSFTSGNGNYQYVNPTTLNGNGRSEAPAMFKANGQYYLVYSTPPCGFCATGVDTEYKTSTAGPLGPWSSPRQISSGSVGAADFCPGQSSSVSPVSTTTGTSYLWQFDMWNTTGSSPATSNNFFAPLSFDGSGNIAQMNCKQLCFTDASTPRQRRLSKPAGRVRPK